ncbi:MAG: NAD-dependent epimerase/dehydratase family protein, partial [Candidatus Omnitrophica bacterium]|nr:NAD-dependent epimerase/dehydratase family protein [Candidatus Omnitrophota bacterium]
LKIACLDNLKRRGSELNLARLRENDIDFIHGDIRCPEDLVLNRKTDLLLECSAEPSVLAGYGDNPAYIINTNLTGTINCLELCRKNKADIIFLSTSRVYPYSKINGLKTIETGTRFEWGKQNKAISGWSAKGIDIDFTLEGPKTLYGATKLASELILQEYITNYGIKGVINRCGIIAGPWQFGKVDQGVFTLWMLAHYFKKPLKYIGFGGKGLQVRDLVHIDDLFELIEKETVSLNKVNGNVYNVGGGRRVSLSLLETTRICEEITGNHIRIGKDSCDRPGDIRVYLTDNKRAVQDLDWSPRKDPKQILSDIQVWINENERKLKQALF